MFNQFKKANMVYELKTLCKLLTNELANLKNLEESDISLESKKEKIEEIRKSIDTIETQIDKLKSEIKLDTDFKNN